MEEEGPELELEGKIRFKHLKTGFGRSRKVQRMRKPDLFKQTRRENNFS